MGRMLIASMLLVFGMAAWLLLNMLVPSSALPFGYEQLIHARIPWWVLAFLWVGGALGIIALVRGRRWYHYPIVLAQCLLVLLFTSYFVQATQFTQLPASALRVKVGDPFPTYTLPDQDGMLHSQTSGMPRERALYVFYRGHW